MKTSLILIVCLFLSFECFSQTESLLGDWKNKSGRIDTILLKRGNNNTEFEIYLKQNYEFIDTSYYWHFYKKDSLVIERVIRSNQIIPLDKPDSVYLGRFERSENINQLPDFEEEKQKIQKIMGDTNKITRRSLPNNIKNRFNQIDSLYSVRTQKEIRLNLWQVESGQWVFKDNILEINKPVCFSGKYKIWFDNKNQIRLIKMF